MNKAEFRQIFERYWKPLVGFCQHYTESEQTGMDIVQDIFYSIWNRRDTLIIRGDIEHYLFKAARLKINDHYRKQYTRSSYENTLLQNFDEAANTTEELIEMKELDHHLLNIVEGLPSRCQEVYKLSREEGYSIAEIANLLTLSEKTVEAHLTKALRLIRQNLPY